MPLTWVNESFTITEDLEKSVAFGVKTLPSLLLGVGLVCLFLGLCCGGFGVYTRMKCAHIPCGPTDPNLMKEDEVGVVNKAIDDDSSSG